LFWFRGSSTTILAEISVPGFLLLNASTQFRIEGPLGKGGSAMVFRGILLDKDLIEQNSTKGVAIKKMDRKRG